MTDQQINQFAKLLNEQLAVSNVQISAKRIAHFVKIAESLPPSNLTSESPKAVSATTEYRTWSAMRERCNNPTHKNFKHYGGRGIRVCERWDSFENFLADMGRKPGSFYSIERKDTNGNYEPDNCKWATDGEQRSNRRNSVFVTINGETKIEAEWTRIANLPKGTVKYRLSRGWPERLLLSPHRTLARALRAERGIHEIAA